MLLSLKIDIYISMGVRVEKRKISAFGGWWSSRRSVGLPLLCSAQMKRRV
jgi:hypothetical protein